MSDRAPRGQTPGRFFGVDRGDGHDYYTVTTPIVEGAQRVFAVDRDPAAGVVTINEFEIRGERRRAVDQLKLPLAKDPH